MRTVLRIALAGALVISPLGASVASASHVSAHAQVVFFRPASEIVGGPYFGSASCAGTDCTVNVAMSGRERSQFNRWCGRDFAQTIPAGEGSVIFHFCTGSGTWRIQVDVWVVEQFHSTPVTIRVVPVRPSN